jgi:NAD(P)H dehydrogenase (quinone)
MSEDALRGAMRGAGLPAFVIDAVASMQTAQANGDYDIITGDVEKLAGRSPRSLSEVLQTLRIQFKDDLYRGNRGSPAQA